MSAVVEPRAAAVPRQLPGQDPFRYGWRYVRRTTPDGEEVRDQVPLTLEDVLHPEEIDFIVNNTAHNRDRAYLKDVLEKRTAGVAGAVVLCVCRVAWDRPGLRAHGPDLALIFGVRGLPRDWGTFDVAVEGVRPVLIVEITSSDTRNNDVVIKVDEYHQAGVPFYVIFDEEWRGEERVPHLTGYRHEPTGYEPMPLDEQGRLWVEPAGLWQAAIAGRVVCYDKEGHEVGDYTAVAQALEAEAQAWAEAEARAKKGRS